MRSLRRRLHGWVMAWMVFQVVSLSALVPRDCCKAHAHQGTTTPSHHETAAGAHCPMPKTDGRPCSMHQDPAIRQHDHGPTASDRSATPPVDGCAMRGSCDGPTAGFIALLSQAGELIDSPSVPATLDRQRIVARVSERIVSRLESPDPPPPRA